MELDLNALRLFVQVAQAGGYAAASRIYGVPRATLSRRIAGLEAELGLRLIERSSRAFRLTAPGEALFAHGQSILATARAASDEIEGRGPAPKGTLRFAVAPSVLQLSLDRMVAAYLDAFPDVSIQIAATNRRVDLRREGFDFAIRAGATGSGPLDQVVLPLAQMAHVLVVAPRWREALRPSLRETLAHVPSLAWAGDGAQPRWRLVDGAGKTQTLPLAPRLAVEDMAALRHAAVAGLGMALLPDVMARADLAAGRLIAYAGDLQAPTGHIHAVHLGNKGMRPVVRHLLDWLRAAYSDTCSSDIL